MTTTAHLITADELWRMPNDQRRELVKGELRTMAPAGFDHGAIAMMIGGKLLNFTTPRKLGIVVSSETGFRLSRDPDTLRAPDVAFVRLGRISGTKRPTTYFDGAPDLAVEVVSPNDTYEEVAEKVDDYLVAGARSVWVVNPKHRTITLHHPGQNPVVLREADTLADEQVLPGFSVPVADVFA